MLDVEYFNQWGSDGTWDLVFAVCLVGGVLGALLGAYLRNRDFSTDPKQKETSKKMTKTERVLVLAGWSVVGFVLGFVMSLVLMTCIVLGGMLWDIASANLHVGRFTVVLGVVLVAGISVGLGLLAVRCNK